MYSLPYPPLTGDASYLWMRDRQKSFYFSFRQVSVEVI